MSQAFDLITSQGNRLILNKESLSYLSKIKDEVVLVTLLSSTDDNNLLGNIKLSLLSSMINCNITNSNSTVCSNLEEPENNIQFLYSLLNFVVNKNSF